MRGLILAGGAGTRLSPVTQVVSKQLLPVYDKPMIFYPLSVLMLAGIREILVISTPHDLTRFQELLGNGSRWGIQLSFIEQPRPEGLAQAFLIGQEFIANDPVCLILGDNIFYGLGFASILQNAAKNNRGATVFGYRVKDPHRFGIAEVTDEGQVLSLEEKPQNPKSNWAVTGIYMYDSDVVNAASTLKPSARGELEITDLNRIYLSRSKLDLVKLGRGVAWLDTGTHTALLQAGQFVSTIEERVGMKIACLEEVAYRMGYISENQLESLASAYLSSDYAEYIKNIVNNF